ncbi:uncharacterized protein LOC124898951 [Capsicum annuum]|uniref:uncharacterized protein LOC124898951 n=1 Tax=Capsicum annuum TaxID=4072 RepID=UPI001FB0913E|nr:uncharacterized protein LOC124898951 [Capsicum annuum]
MSVKEYGLKFTKLSRYASTMRAKMLKFVSELAKYVWKECKAALLISDMDISRVQGFQSQKGGSYRVPSYPACTICGKNHPGECRYGKGECYGCDQRGHMQKYCPSTNKINGGNIAQSSASVPTAGQSTTLGTGRVQNHLYALGNLQDLEASPNVVTGMLKVFSEDVYVQLEPGASLSFVTLYVAMKFGVFPKQILDSFSISTPAGESIIARQVYRDCVNEGGQVLVSQQTSS